MTKRDALMDLARGACRCGRWKARGKSHCKSCYFALPKDLQRRLYLKLGEGYEEAYAESLAVLEKTGGGWKYYAELSNGLIVDCALLYLFDGCQIFSRGFEKPVIFVLGGAIQGAAMPTKYSAADGSIIPRSGAPTREEALESIACVGNNWYGGTRRLFERLKSEHEEEITRLERSIEDEVADHRELIATFDRRMAALPPEVQA